MVKSKGGIDLRAMCVETRQSGGAGESNVETRPLIQEQAVIPGKNRPRKLCRPAANFRGALFSNSTPCPLSSSNDRVEVVT